MIEIIHSTNFDLYRNDNLSQTLKTQIYVHKSTTTKHVCNRMQSTLYFYIIALLCGCFDTNNLQKYCKK